MGSVDLVLIGIVVLVAMIGLGWFIYEARK